MRRWRLIGRLGREQLGLTTMEYGLLAAAAIVAVATVLLGLSTDLSQIFSTISSSL